MGWKSRGNWPTGICLRKCANRDIKCDDCFRFSEYKALETQKEGIDGSEIKLSVPTDGQG